MKKQPAPLIIEQHPKTYTGFPFITLIQYHKQPMLCIVDNITDSTIRAFVLDMCGPAGVSEEVVINAAHLWHQLCEETPDRRIPASIYFAKIGIGAETSKIYRTMNVEFISRVVGPVPNFQTDGVRSSKRRRRKPIPANIHVYQDGSIVNSQFVF